MKDEPAVLLAGADPAWAFRRSDASYAEAVSGFNLSISHTPELVMVPREAADVQEAVRSAASAGTTVAVHSSGHGAYLPVTGGVLLNMRAMDSVHIDPEARTATAGGGARWRDVAAAAAPHGLGAPSGSTSDVAVVGYLLGGGLPVLGRAVGFAADRLRSVDLVTADGELRTVTAASDPDLFWALRGGGHGLGVVTAMTFGLLDLAQIAGGGIFFPGENAEDVLATYAEWVSTIPDDLCTSLAFLRLPPMPEVPELLRGRLAMHLRITHPDPAADLDELLAPMRSCAPVLLDTVGLLPYDQLDTIHQDPVDPVPAADRGLLLDGLSSEAQQVLLEQVGPQAESTLLIVELRHLGGALRTPPPGGGAIAGRDAAFSIYAVGMAAGPGAAIVSSALESLCGALEPHAHPHSLVNLQGTNSAPEGRASAWDAEQLSRLRQVKARIDPENLFRYGHSLLAR